jgi:hypothetical protein
MPVGDCDHIGCFTDQVKLTRALVWDLNEAIKEVKLLGEHGEEASQKITELEALCKRLSGDAQKLREEKTKLEGMDESRDERIMEFADKYGYNHSDEDADNEDEDDGGDVIAPLAAAAPPLTSTPAAAAPEVIAIDEEDPVEMVPEQEAPEAHEVILADAEPELLQPRLFHVIMGDYEESPSRMIDGPHELDDLDDLDDPIEADYDVDEWFPTDGSNDQDWLIESKSLCLGLRICH